LDSFRKPEATDREPDKRPKPEIIQNIPQPRRKEKSIYKPTDLWTAEDDLLFLKYYNPLTFRQKTKKESVNY